MNRDPTRHGVCWKLVGRPEKKGERGVLSPMGMDARESFAPALSPTYEIGGFYRWALIRLFGFTHDLPRLLWSRFCTADWLLGFLAAAVLLTHTPLGR